MSLVTMYFSVFVLFLVGFGMRVTNAAPTCFSCEHCAVCSSAVPRPGNLLEVTLNFDACKGSAISWACCRNSIVPGPVQEALCDMVFCDASLAQWEVTKNKCNNVTSASFLVPATATSVVVQLHDGKFIGNKLCSDNNACCGGSSGACSNTGVCEVTISLEGCAPPPPECMVNEDCSPSEHLCERPVCVGGVCLQENLPAGTVCRPTTDPCDVGEVCTGFERDCPPDLRKDHGYTFKCGTDQFLCAIPSSEVISSGSGKAFWINPTGENGEGTCNIGTARTVTELSWPHCSTQCIEKICPNGKQISNYALTSCNATTGHWTCDNKVDVTYDVLLGLPVCPHA